MYAVGAPKKKAKTGSPLESWEIDNPKGKQEEPRGN